MKECQRLYFCIWCMTYGWSPTCQLADQQSARGDRLHFFPHTLFDPRYMITGSWMLLYFEVKKTKVVNFWLMIDDKGRLHYCMNQGGPAMTQPTMWGCPPPSSSVLMSQTRVDHNFCLNWYDIFRLRMQDTLDVESLSGKGERGRRRVELFGFARSKGSWSGFFVAHTTAGLVISF